MSIAKILLKLEQISDLHELVSLHPVETFICPIEESPGHSEPADDRSEVLGDDIVDNADRESDFDL